jgi:hypothetical protein
MTKKISFISKDSFIHKNINSFLPSKKYIPEWYKKSPMWADDNGNPQKMGFSSKKTIKTCMPFLDSLTTGYTLETWCDIHVSQSLDDHIQVKWSDESIDPIEFRGSATSMLMPVPLGCKPDHFVWKIPFGIKTLPGYSVILTHPLNRFDLPFVTLSGIMDTDNGMHGGNIPVFFSDTFEGIIPVGTPIAQIIPFKRDSWQSETIDDEMLYKGLEYEINKFFVGGYKKLRWKKKKFD